MRADSSKVADVSVVVPVHDDRCNLQHTLDALSRGAYEVVVVDNGSQDGSRQLVESRFPSVELIELRANRGYAAAANAGLAIASGRYVLVLNSDASPAAAAIERLVAYLDAHPDVGVAGPRLLNADGTLQRSVRGFPTLWRLATEFFFLRKLAPRSNVLNAFYGAGFDHTTARDCEFVKGAALLLRRAALDRVGGFDEEFFVFSEDVDLCYRMRAGGWKVAFVPDAEFVHVGGASTQPRWDRMFREQLRGHVLFIAKHHGRAQAAWARGIVLAGLILRSIVFRGTRRRIYRRAARWLVSAELDTLVGPR